MATDSTLYLHDAALSYKEVPGEKIVTLVPLSAVPTSQDVALALANMTQKLLNTVQKMLQFMSKTAEQNAETNNINTSVATQEADKAVKAMADLKAWENSFWNIFLKYVLGPVLAIVGLGLAAFTGGATAFLLTALVIVITAIPVHEGKGMLSSLVDVTVEAMGKQFGWSQSTIDLVKGTVNLVAGIVLGVVCGAAAASAVASTATALASTSIGIMTGLSAATAQISSSNSFQDIFQGIFLSTGMEDAQSEQIAAIVGLVLNLLLMVASLGYGFKAAGNVAGITGSTTSLLNTAKQVLGENSMITKMIAYLSDSSTTIGSMLSKLTSGNILNGLRWTEVGAGLAACAAHVGNGDAEREAANLRADIATIKGFLNLFDNNSKVIEEMTTLVTQAQSEVFKRFNALQQSPNFLRTISMEANLIAQNNRA